MSTLLGRRLAEVQAEGRGVFEATLHAPLGADLAELGEVVAKFRRALAEANRRGGDLRYIAVLHAVGRRGGPPHWHLAIHSSQRAAEVRAIVSAAWTSATGSLRFRVHFAPIRDPLAFAQYIFRDTAEGRAEPQLLRRFGLATHFGNHVFGAGGLQGAWKIVCAERHGEVATEDAATSGSETTSASAAAEVVDRHGEPEATNGRGGRHRRRGRRVGGRRRFSRDGPRGRAPGVASEGL